MDAVSYRQEQMLQELVPTPQEVQLGANFFLWLQGNEEMLEQVLKPHMDTQRLTHILHKFNTTCNQNVIQFWSCCSSDIRGFLLSGFYRSMIKTLELTESLFYLHFHIMVCREGGRDMCLYRNLLMPIYRGHDSLRQLIRWFNIVTPRKELQEYELDVMYWSRTTLSDPPSTAPRGPSLASEESAEEEQFFLKKEKLQNKVTCEQNDYVLMVFVLSITT